MRTGPKVEPDSDGLILWQVAVAPKQKQLLTLSYTTKECHELGVGAVPSVV